MNKKDINNALLIKVLQDIMLRDSSVSLKRIVLHIRTQYKKSKITEKEVNKAFVDAEKIVRDTYG